MSRWAALGKRRRQHERAPCSSARHLPRPRPDNASRTAGNCAAAHTGKERTSAPIPRLPHPNASVPLEGN
eukprot:3781675-Heterocapsa_arctica.AAC.1